MKTFPNTEIKLMRILVNQNVLNYFTLVFLFYICYTLNCCLFDKRKSTYYFSRHHFLSRNIFNDKNATGTLTPSLGLKSENGNIYGIQEAIKRLPNALVIGVKKCGTRALINFIRIHPSVQAPKREVHFFDKYYNNGIEWYRDQMLPSQAGQITMEKTPNYWLKKHAPSQVFAMNPAVKLLVVVRDPVIRAISHYTEIASKIPNLPRFEELAIVNHTVGWDGVVNASWPPISTGVYAKPLTKWLELFPRSSLLLVNGERLMTDPVAEMARVQEFLGLKQVIKRKHFQLNHSTGFYCLRKSKNRYALGCLGKSKGRTHPHVDPLVIEKLRDYYRPFNKLFYRVSGMNFGWP